MTLQTRTYAVKIFKSLCSDLKLKIKILFQLTTQMETLNDKSAISDSDLRADMERWHKHKHKDLRELFIEMADRNIKHYEKVKLLNCNCVLARIQPPQL